MRFDPKSEREIAEANLLPPGEYDFEITDAFESVSKSSGKDMITLKIKVFAEDGSSVFVSDYLLESVAYKLRHACEAVGLLDAYESGELDANDFKNQAGRLKLRIDKDKTGQYPDKNGVQDYVKVAAPSTTPRQPAPRRQLEHAHSSSRPDLDDEIPF